MRIEGVVTPSSSQTDHTFRKIYRKKEIREAIEIEFDYHWKNLITVNRNGSRGTSNNCAAEQDCNYFLRKTKLRAIFALLYRFRCTSNPPLVSYFKKSPIAGVPVPVAMANQFGKLISFIQYSTNVIIASYILNSMW